MLLTFLDPVCVSDCPLIAQEFRQAGQMLGVHNPHVELVAVNVNPLYHEEAYIQAFDRQEGLSDAPDWLYLTGSETTLRKVYKEYGVPSETLPAGAMLGHNDIAFVIDRQGELTEQLDLDPGPGTAATKSSFATELAEAANKTLARSTRGSLTRFATAAAVAGLALAAAGCGRAAPAKPVHQAAAATVRPRPARQRWSPRCRPPARRGPRSRWAPPPGRTSSGSCSPGPRAARAAAADATGYRHQRRAGAGRDGNHADRRDPAQH